MNNVTNKKRYKLTFSASPLYNSMCLGYSFIHMQNMYTCEIITVDLWKVKNNPQKKLHCLSCVYHDLSIKTPVENLLRLGCVIYICQTLYLKDHWLVCCQDVHTMVWMTFVMWCIDTWCESCVIGHSLSKMADCLAWPRSTTALLLVLNMLTGMTY